ncbi:MAG: hypothetical protein AAFR17_12710 [Pseudomonadota bacterium]
MSKLTTTNDYPTNDDIDRYVAIAHNMRSKAIRETGVSLGQIIVALPARVIATITGRKAAAGH